MNQQIIKLNEQQSISKDQYQALSYIQSNNKYRKHINAMPSDLAEIYVAKPSKTYEVNAKFVMIKEKKVYMASSQRDFIPGKNLKLIQAHLSHCLTPWSKNLGDLIQAPKKEEDRFNQLSQPKTLMDNVTLRININKQMIKNKSRKFKDYLQAIIKLQITLHQSILKLPQIMQSFFLLFGTLQSVTFLLRPNYYVINQSDKYADIIYFQIYLCRPDLIVIDIFTFINSHYYCLFTLILIIIMEGIVLQIQAREYLHKENKTQPLRQQLTLNSTIGSIFINLYSAYSQLFLVYFKIPLYILATHQIISTTNDLDVGMLTIGILTLIILFFVDNFKEVICKPSCNTKIDGFEVVEYQKLDLIVQLLKLIQIAIYLFTTTQEVSTFLQGALIICISIIKIYQTVITINYIKYQFIIILITTQSISLAYVFCTIFKYQDLVFLLSLLLITLLNKQVQISLNNIFIEFEHSQNSNKIKVFMVLYINSNMQQDTSIFQLHQLIAVSKHRVKCQKTTCFCKTDILYLPQNTFKKLLLKKVHSDNLKNQNKFKQVIVADLLFYIASLHYLGFTVLAFQQAMNIVNDNQSDRKAQQWVKNVAKDIRLSSSRTLKSNPSDSKRQNAQQKHDVSKNIISNRIQNKSSLEEARLNLLQSDISAQLMENFMKKSDSSQIQISEAVNLFLQSEFGQATVKEQILLLLSQKIQFFQLLLGTYTSTILYDRAKEISQNFVKVEDDLIKQYEKFPSQKLQAVICFLQGEIFNDYLKAFKYANFTTITDEKLINMRKNLKLNLFSNKITYINVKLSDNLEALQIQSLSNNAHLFFEYQYEEFKKNQYLNFLIPDAVVNEHGLMITQFIQTGSNKFFRNQNLNFFKLQNQFIQQFNMLFDINNYVLDGIYFAVFCELIDQAAAHILLDINLIVAGISKNLFEKIGYRSRQIKEYTQLILECYKVSITQLIPNFDEISKSTQKQFNVKLNLLDVLRQASTQSQQKSNSSSLKHWSSEKDINCYEATLSIHERQIYGLSYYIIEIDDLRQNVKSLKSQKCSVKMKTQFISKKHNLEDRSHMEQISDSFNEISDIDDSIEEGSVRLPQDVQNKLFIQEYDKVQKEALQQQQQIQLQNQDNSMLNPVQTPNQSLARLLNQVQDKFIIQQTFFNLEIQKDENDSYSVSQNVKQEIQEVHDVDRNMQQQIQNQLYQDKENRFIDDQGSQVSSLAGVRKSTYFKKYDVLQAMILRGKMPLSFKYCISQIVIFILVSSTYNVLVLQQNSVDLSRFIQYVDMLSFNQYFMAPYGMFTSSRLIWAQYPTDYFYKSFNQSVYNVILPWMQTTFGQQFAAMRSNFQMQFQNAYLQEFFNDDYLRVYYQQTSPNNLTLVNITFKETLFQFLNYQYMYKIGYDQNRPIASMPMQTYSWINYFILTDHFDSLTENILVYTQDAKDVISEKWWIQSSVFISLTGLIIIIGYLFYLAFLTNYDSYLEIFSFTDTSSILKDIDRYKIFLNLLSKDSDVMFKYVFELDVKEQFILTYQTLQKQVNLNHKVTKKKQSDQKHKLPYLNSLIGFTFVYALFFAFTFITTSQTQTYLEKYSRTVVFYKQLADLDTRVCGIYGDKLFANVILTFTFYGKQNLTDIQNRILQSTQIMSNFSALAQNIDQTQYLFSSNFSAYLSSAKTGSICSLLSPVFFTYIQTDLAYAGQFCIVAFDGSLLLGLSNSLNFIINEVATEYTVNQFKVRIIGSNTFSVQGAYILSRVLESLVQQLKDSIVISTNTQLSMVQSFCISYLVYAFGLMILLMYFIVNYYSDEYYYTKRFVLLVPSQTLLLNDNLERQLRLYIARDAQ